MQNGFVSGGRIGMRMGGGGGHRCQRPRLLLFAKGGDEAETLWNFSSKSNNTKQK